MNIVRLFLSPGISQHFHNKKQFMRSESFECLTLYNLNSGMLAKRELAPCLLKKALEALLWHQIVLVPAYLVERTFALIKCCLLLLNVRSVFFFFYYGMSLVAPKKQLRESPVRLVLQSADDPVITAGKIQLHSNTAGLSDKSRCETSQPAWHWQLLQFCFYYTIFIAIRLFQTDSYIGIGLLW